MEARHQSLTSAHMPDGSVARRDFLTKTASAISAVFAGLQLPSRALGEAVAESRLFRHRNLEDSHRLWSEQAEVQGIPPLNTFKAAVELCREATCVVAFVRDGVVRATHSAFVVSIPSRLQKRYVVTCDHARLETNLGTVRLFLSNFENAVVLRELVFPFKNGRNPSVDLRILECEPKAFAGIRGLPLSDLSEQIPTNAAMMIYEPPTVRIPMMLDPSTGLIAPYRDTSMDVRLERLVLTRHAAETPFSEDSAYADNTGFRTAGQLPVGGSGSPVLLFDQNGFRVAGHQVSYGSRKVDELCVDGELDFDGVAVHVRHALKLLKLSNVLP